jgi:hypothetical protein
MTVTLDLTSELENRIVAAAAAQGLSVEAYLVSVIGTIAVPAAGERASVREFEAAMDRLAEGLDHVPVLAPEALSRESLYGHRS